MYVPHFVYQLFFTITGLEYRCFFRSLMYTKALGMANQRHMVSALWSRSFLRHRTNMPQRRWCLLVSSKSWATSLGCAKSVGGTPTITNNFYNRAFINLTLSRKRDWEHKRRRSSDWVYINREVICNGQVVVQAVVTLNSLMIPSSIRMNPCKLGDLITWAREHLLFQ